MGRKSVQENKSVYLLSREKTGFTREEASEKIGYISASSIERIENGKKIAKPSEVKALAECYKDPSLCNYYCTHDCELGQAYVPVVKTKPLSQITLDVLANLNRLSKEKDRLIEITVDGDISEDEYKDFAQIQEHLQQMSMAIDTMQLWIDKKIGDGKFNGKLN